MENSQTPSQPLCRILALILALGIAGCASEVALAHTASASATTAASDPTSERPPVSYLDREEHWQVNCRAELRQLAAGEDTQATDPDVLRRCSYIHIAVERPICAEVFAQLATTELPAARRSALANAVLDPHTDNPLDEGQCAAARQTVQ